MKLVENLLEFLVFDHFRFTKLQKNQPAAATKSDLDDSDLLLKDVDVWPNTDFEKLISPKIVFRKIVFREIVFANCDQLRKK